MTPKDIIEFDLDSVPVGSNRADYYQERFIHGEIYTARPDAMAVVHSHTPELLSFGTSTVKLRPVVNGGTFMGGGLPIFDIRPFRTAAGETIISSPALGRSLAQSLGNKPAVLLLGHGTVVVSNSLYGLVGRSNGLRNNARIQHQAIALGGEVTYLDTPLPGVPLTIRPETNRVTGDGGGRAWEYWVRKISIE